MRKIEKEMLNAIAQKKNWRKDNTRVSTGTGTNVYLYNNLLCTITEDSVLWNLPVLQKWPTRTTKSRCHAIASVYDLTFVFPK